MWFITLGQTARQTLFYRCWHRLISHYFKGYSTNGLKSRKLIFLQWTCQSFTLLIYVNKSLQKNKILWLWVICQNLFSLDFDLQLYTCIRTFWKSLNYPLPLGDTKFLNLQGSVSLLWNITGKYFYIVIIFCLNVSYHLLIFHSVLSDCIVTDWCNKCS